MAEILLGHVVGPAGPAGPIGPEGPQGIQGPQGPPVPIVDELGTGSASGAASARIVDEVNAALSDVANDAWNTTSLPVETGEWPIAFNSDTVTYQYNYGYYSRVGKLINVWGICTITSKGASSGSVAVTGLPFTITGSRYLFRGSVVLHALGVNSQDKNNLIAHFIGGANTLTLYRVDQSSASGAEITLTYEDSLDGLGLVITGSYLID